jgi:hypothetical protein
MSDTFGEPWIAFLFCSRGEYGQILVFLPKYGRFPPRPCATKAHSIESDSAMYFTPNGMRNPAGTRMGGSFFLRRGAKKECPNWQIIRADFRLMAEMIYSGLNTGSVCQSEDLFLVSIAIVSTYIKNTMGIGYFEKRSDLFRKKPVNLASQQCPPFWMGGVGGLMQIEGRLWLSKRSR